MLSCVLPSQVSCLGRYGRGILLLSSYEKKNKDKIKTKLRSATLWCGIFAGDILEKTTMNYLK
jgi:hypothetical protein